VGGGSKMHNEIKMKFCIGVVVTDVNAHSNFSNYRLGFFGDRGLNFTLFRFALCHYCAKLLPTCDIRGGHITQPLRYIFCGPETFSLGCVRLLTYLLKNM